MLELKTDQVERDSIYETSVTENYKKIRGRGVENKEDI